MKGKAQADMVSYPFYRIEGKEVHEVAVGPIHAGVIEPGSFRFMCLGEQVHHLEIHLGYQHRGVERRLLQRDPVHLAPLIETIAGDTSVGHTWAYCAAVESLASCDMGDRAGTRRGIALELERVAMHLSTLSGIAADIGFLQGATTYGRLRTTAINMMMRFCGSRFGRGALRPGGVGMRLWPELQPETSADLDLLPSDVEIINDCFLGANTVRHRLRGRRRLARVEALDLGVVGRLPAPPASCSTSGTRRPKARTKSSHRTRRCSTAATAGVGHASASRRIAASLKWLEPPSRPLARGTALDRTG